MKVALTGSSSHLAKVLLPDLCNHPNVNHVSGIDIKPGSFSHPKFSFIQQDIRSSEIINILKNHDAVIHTAFVVLRSSLGSQSKNRDFAKDININGSLNVFSATLKNNIPTLIHISSASVYGALPGNPATFTETSQRRVMHRLAETDRPPRGHPRSSYRRSHGMFDRHRVPCRTPRCSTHRRASSLRCSPGSTFPWSHR